jgi:hypothetical protein
MVGVMQISLKLKTLPNLRRIEEHVNEQLVWASPFGAKAPYL